MKRKDDGVDVGGKAPGFWFYPADYERDMALLPLEAQALWMRVLCRMHFAGRRGYLEHPTGESISPEELGRMVGLPTARTNKLLSELERCGVFSREPNGTIYNRRMVRDTEISRVRRNAASARLHAAERDSAGHFAPANDPANSPAKTEFAPPKRPPKTPSNGKTLLQQKPVLSDSVSVLQENTAAAANGTAVAAAAAGVDLARFPHACRNIAGAFPATDAAMQARIIAAAQAADPEASDAMIARALFESVRKDQTTAALWLHTLPAWLANMRRDQPAMMEALEQQIAGDRT